MTDLELLQYLFIDKKIYSFNGLYKFAKMAHPKITQKIVKNFFNSQQSTQMLVKNYLNQFIVSQIIAFKLI